MNTLNQDRIPAPAKAPIAIRNWPALGKGSCDPRLRELDRNKDQNPNDGDEKALSPHQPRVFLEKHATDPRASCESRAADLLCPRRLNSSVEKPLLSLLQRLPLRVLPQKLLVHGHCGGRKSAADIGPNVVLV